MKRNVDFINYAYRVQVRTKICMISNKNFLLMRTNIKYNRLLHSCNKSYAVFISIAYLQNKMFHKVTFRTSPRYKISTIVLKEVPSDDNKVNKREFSPNEVLCKYQNKYDVQIPFYLHPVNK